MKLYLVLTVFLLTYSAFSQTTIPNTTGVLCGTGTGSAQSCNGAVVGSGTTTTLRDIVSAKDFGAVNDGVTDNYTALQNAINSACANTSNLPFGQGSLLNIPGGTNSYAYSKPLLVNCNNVIIQGQDQATILAPSFSYGPALVVRPAASTASGAYQLFPTTNALVGSGYAMSLNGSYASFLDLAEVIAPGTMNGLGSFTIECDIKPSSVSSDSVIMSSYGQKGSLPATSAFTLGFSGGNLAAPFAKATIGGVPYSLGATGMLSANTLAHLAFTYDGSTLRLFVNGTLAASQSATGTLSQQPTENMTIGPELGPWPNGSLLTRSFTGAIDNIRVSSVARYTSNFTPPSAKFSQDASTLALYIFDSQFDSFTKVYGVNTLSGWAMWHISDLIVNFQGNITLSDLTIKQQAEGSGVSCLFSPGSEFDDIRVFLGYRLMSFETNCYDTGIKNLHLVAGSEWDLFIGPANAILSISKPGFFGGQYQFVTSGDSSVDVSDGWFQTEVQTLESIVINADFQSIDNYTFSNPYFSTESGGNSLSDLMFLANIGGIINITGGYFEATNTIPAITIQGGNQINLTGNNFYGSANAGETINVLSPPTNPIQYTANTRTSTTQPISNNMSAFAASALTSISGTGPVVVTSGTTPTISINNAANSSSGLVKVSGNTSTAASTTGTISPGDCAKWDANLNLIDAGLPCLFGPLSTTIGNVPQYGNSSGTSLSPGLGVVTTVGIPGSDANLATEKSIRTAIAAAASSVLPAQNGTLGYLTTNGSSIYWGPISTGGSGALNCTTGVCDIVTALVPLKASANTWTGANDFSASPFLKIVTGTGVPPSSGCASSTNVGEVYMRTDAMAPNSSFYVCSQTGSSVYNWELPSSATTSFSTLGAGTNTGTTLVVGTGSTLSATGTGAIAATSVPAAGVSGLAKSATTDTTNASNITSGTLAIANGGTGTATPSLVAGNNVTISGAFPNQTISSFMGEAVNAQTATTYTASSSDAGKLTTLTNASPVAVSLPSASSAGFTAFLADYVNNGAGTVTITPTSGTIGGASSATLTTGQSVRIVSDGANYQLLPGKAATANPAFSTIATGTNTTAALTVGTGASLTTSGSGTITATAVPATGVTGILTVAKGGTGTATPSIVAGSNINVSGTWPNQTVALTGTVPVANGGTGTSTPALVAGTNVTLSGSFPNQTVNAVTTAAQSINAQTGTTYTVVSSDSGKLTTLKNASAVAVTIPAASATGFTTFFADYLNNGPGSVTITPASGAIGGAASATLTTGQSARIISDGANYQLLPGKASTANSAFSAITAGTNTNAALVVGSGASLAAAGTGTIAATSVPASGVTGLAPSATTDTTNASNISSGTLAITRGGTGTATPSLVAGNNVTISGAFPNQTISSFRAEPVNAQTATSYTAVSTDSGSLTTLNNASPVTVTLPSASTAGFTTFLADYLNNGAGTVTITPASGTIGGGSSVTLTTGQSLRVISDGTNYQVLPGKASAANTNFSALMSGTNNTAALTVGSGASLAATGSGTIAATSVPASGVTGLAPSATTDATNASNISSGTLAITRGGTGTATPSLVAGNNVTITGAFPNQTISSLIGEPVNAQTAMTYTAASSDTGKLTTLTNASSVAVSLPSASSAGFTTFLADYLNNGAGAVTITPASGTIGGGSSVTLTTGQSLRVISDGTNYQVLPGKASAANTAFSALTSGTNNTAALTVGSGASLAAAGSGTIAATSVPASGVTGLAPSATTDTTNAANITSGTLGIGNGGTGTATPSLVAGNNVTITGAFPNQTISSFRSEPVNAQTAMTYTAASSDSGKLTTLTNASSVAVSLPSASSAGFTTFLADYLNNGAGAVTITPASGTIGGGSSIALTTGQSIRVISDGTNYQVLPGKASAANTAFSALTSGTNNTAALTVGSGASLAAAGSGTITATSVPASGVTGLAPSATTDTTNASNISSGTLAITRGGTGTATPSLVAGNNVTITGAFPNQTISSLIGEPVNAQTAMTYTAASSDTGKLTTLTNASSVAVSLPSASSAGFTTFLADYLNNGAGAVTITPASGTIGGSSSVTLTTGQSLRVISDGTNYQVLPGKASAANTNFSALMSGTNNTAALTVGSGASLAAAGSGTIAATSVPASGVTGLAASATTDTTNASNISSGTLAIARGGTGTATPSLVAGNNVTITGTFPNQTISSSSAEAVNAQTGTSYTATSSDTGKLTTLTNASSVAVSLPSASSAGFTTFLADYLDNGAGTVTITPASGTIGGGSSVTLTTGQSLRVISDGTNYQVLPGKASTANSSFSSITSGTNNTAALTVGSGASIAAAGSGTITATAVPASGVTGVLPVANGGNGTATPSLVAGANVSITGNWPNQTISSSGGSGTTLPATTDVICGNGAGAGADCGFAPANVVQTNIAKTITTNGAASTPSLLFTGTWFTGGTSTTTKPQFLIEPTGANSSGWNTNGTGLGVNAASGFTGNLLDAQVNGNSQFSVSGSGTFQLGTPTTNGNIKSVVNGVQSYFGIYNSATGLYYALQNSLNVVPGVAGFGGYYHGMGVLATSSSGGNPIFGVLNSGQAGNGLSHTAFTIYDNNKVYTFNTTLDDGSGNMSVVGSVAAKQLQGSGTAPAASVSGSGCAIGAAIGTNLAGLIPVTGTGSACRITLTWATAFAYQNHSLCGPLQDRTSGLIVAQTGDTTTSATFAALAVTSGDIIQYGMCTGY